MPSFSSARGLRALIVAGCAIAVGFTTNSASAMAASLYEPVVYIYEAGVLTATSDTISPEGGVFWGLTQIGTVSEDGSVCDESGDVIGVVEY